MILEADKSKVGKLETQESQRCSSGPIASTPETQEELMFQLSSKGRKHPYIPTLRQSASKNSLYLGNSQPFCPIQAFNRLDELHSN